MKTEISLLVSKTLKFLDETENFPSAETEPSEGCSTITTLIEAMLPQVATEVVANASRRDISAWKEADAEVEWIAPGHGRIELPDDFLRLGLFRMSDWNRALAEPMEFGSEEYQLRCDSRNNGRRRSAAMVIVEGGRRRALEFFGSMNPGAYVETLTYLPHPVGDDPDSLELPASCLLTVAQTTAERVAKRLNS